MTIEETIQKDQINNIENISKKEMNSSIWSRVIIKDIDICSTTVYCKTDKKELNNSSYNTEWVYELSSEFNNPKKNLEKFFSNNYQHKYLDQDRKKIFESISNLKEFKYKDNTWLYYKDKKVKIDIESLDGSYQESFFVEYEKSFNNTPAFEKEDKKDNHRFVAKLLEKRLGRSIIVKQKNDSLISRFDINDPPDPIIDKCSNITKKVFLFFIFTSVLLIGNLIFISPLYIFSILLSPIVAVLLFYIYMFVGCKYLCLLGFFYPLEITTRIGNYIYSDKYKLKALNE